jgi:hypothetical protein
MGLTKEGKIKHLSAILMQPADSSEELNRVAGEVRAFGFEYCFPTDELRRKAYSLLFGITEQREMQASEYLYNLSRFR